MKALNVSGGSKVALKIDRAHEQLDIDTAGYRGRGRLHHPADREDGQGETTWLTSDMPVHLDAGDVAHLDCGTAAKPGSPLELQIRTRDGRTRTEQVPEQR